MKCDQYRNIYVGFDFLDPTKVNVCRCCANRSQVYTSFTFDELKNIDLMSKLKEVVKENTPKNWSPCSYFNGQCSFPDNVDGIQLSLYTGCNAKCDFCSQKDTFKNNNKLQEKKVYLSYLNSITNNFKRVFLSDTGENLTILPEIKEWLKSLKENQFEYIFFNTNGILIDNEFIDIVKSCKVKVYMNVSLNATDRETYKEIVGIDAFDKVYNNISKLVDAGIEVSSSFVYYEKLKNKLDLSKIPFRKIIIPKDGNQDIFNSEEFQSLLKMSSLGVKFSEE